MGLLSETTYFGCLIPVHLLTICFLCWVFHFVYGTTFGAVPKKSAFDRFQKEEVLCPCLFRRFSTAQFTAGCTVASVGCFILCAMALIGASITCFTVSGECKRDGGWPALVGALMSIHSLSLNFGFMFMFVTHFERLRLTFIGTSVLYAVFVLCTLLAFAFWVFAKIEPLAAAVCMLLGLIIYFGSVSVLIRAFYKKTMAVGRSSHDAGIVDTAVRITISSSVSLLSTSVAPLLWVVLMAICPNCLLWILLGLVYVAFVMCVNAFCLMCSFGCAQRYYHLAFGRLHSLFLAKVLVDDKQKTDVSMAAISLAVTTPTEGPASVLPLAATPATHEAMASASDA